jgi:threonine/homoserine/homoserine lactone efflux protein
MQHFIPDLTVIFAFALASIVLAITPGPDMALFISRTVNYGRTHGIAAVLGATTGLFIHIALAAFGISLLLIAAPTAFFALKITGALYLLWLAIQALRQSGTLSLTARAKRQPTPWQSYLTGIGINLTNPKVVLFFVTFLPQFVSRTDPYASGKLLFLGGEFLLLSVPIVIAIVWGAEWVTAILTRSVRAQKLLNWSFAAVFAGFAVAILAVEGRR